jgi:ribosomal protein L11 methyltransferase
MSWIEIELNISQEKLEQISGYIFALGCEGLNVTSEGVTAYFTKHSWSDEIKLGLIEFIGQVIPSFSARDIRVKALSKYDWMVNWKEFFKPVKITSRIIIIPPWEKYHKQEGEKVIIINPKMAFGTGHHDTTQLIIRALDKWVKPGMKVLDVGTGSGILALVCEKLGVESILGIDNDITAIRNASENARLNKSTGNVRFILGQLEQFQPTEYNLILANINAKVLQDYAKLFPDYLIAQGKIVISGLLRSDEPKMIDVYQKSGFKLLTKDTSKEWLSLAFELKEKEAKKDGDRNSIPAQETQPYFSNNEDLIYKDDR